MEEIRVDLQENVVSQDYVEVAPDGWQFKGGIRYILHYFTPATEWTDREHARYFKSLERLEEAYNKLNRGNLEDDYCFNDRVALYNDR